MSEPEVFFGRAPVRMVTVRDTAGRLAALARAAADVREAGSVAELACHEAAEFGVDVELATEVAPR